MESQIVLTLVNNAALLLLIVYLYDLASTPVRFRTLAMTRVPLGIALGLVGVVIMLNPLRVSEGVFFDSRYVLLGISGLFFGWMATLVVAFMTSAYRLYAGGAGAWIGVIAIFAVSSIGLLWRHWRRNTRSEIGVRELYLFGIAVQVVALQMLLLLVPGKMLEVLRSVAWPVILIYPIATVLLGTMIGRRMRQDQQADALAISEAHFHALYQYAPVPLWKEDRSAVMAAVAEIRAAGYADLRAYLRDRPGEAWRLAGMVRLLDANEAALCLAGAASLDDLKGGINSLFDESTMEAFVEQLCLMGEGQRAYQGEASMVRLDGEERNIVISLFVLPGHEVKGDMVIVSTLDISEHRHFETEIRNSYKLLANLSAHVPGMIFQYQSTLDGKGYYPYVSPGVANIYEATPEEVMAYPDIIFERFHPEDRSRLLATIEYSMRTMEPWSEEYRVLLPTKGECWRSGSAQPQRQADGSTLWYGYVRDITEHKRAQSRLQLASRVFDSASEAILVTDANSQIIAVNPAFTRVTGYAEADVLGRNPSLLSSGRHDASFYRTMWQTLAAEGSWSGDIWNRRKNGEIYPEWLSISAVSGSDGKIEYYVAVFSDLTELHRARVMAERIALEDVMTGLGNRSAFVQQLDKRITELSTGHRYAAVLLFDIDRFKEVNELSGLMAGDMLLKEVGTRLRQALGLEHFVARVGADEFAVLLASQSFSRDEAGRLALSLAEQLIQQLFGAYRVDTAILEINFSTGIVVFPQHPGDKASDVLQQADWAVSQSRREGGGNTVFFQTVMGQQIRERYRLEKELRMAAPLGQLRMYVQPQIDAAGRQVSAETLIRWEHPERGLVPPGMFIPLAEASELIFELERWMLGEVCRLIAHLESKGQALRLSVNISAKHFEQEGFVDELRRHLSQAGANPAQLVLEITESIIIDNVNEVTTKMLELAGMGIQFSLDDFGTGYSSLSYLKRLPIHELKIDRSFIKDAPTDASDAALVETILGVARTLGLQVVAEGVETQEQADFLKARGDVIHQGYLYDKPLPLAEWLKKYFGQTS